MNFLRRAASFFNKRQGNNTAGEQITRSLKNVLIKKMSVPIILSVVFPILIIVMIFLTFVASYGYKLNLIQFSDSGVRNNGTISASSNLANAMVNLAVSQLNDNSRIGGEKYWRYCGFSYKVSWCACFVTWVVDNTEHNGKKLTDVLTSGGGAVCDAYMDESKEKGFYKKNDGNYTPQEGDIVWFIWGGTGSTICDHIGIVQRVENNQIITIEGNASDSVAERTYPLNDSRVIGFSHWY